MSEQEINHQTHLHDLPKPQSQETSLQSIDKNRETITNLPGIDVLKPTTAEESLQNHEEVTSNLNEMDVLQNTNNTMQDTSIQMLENQQEMMNMFASVWVKVEVGDERDADEGSSMVYETGHESSLYGLSKRTKHKKSLKCDQCDYTTAYKNCLNLHVLGHTQAKPFSCDLCNYETKYPTALQRHIIIKHQASEPDVTDKTVPVYKCDGCDYTTYYKWNLKAHKRKHLEKQFKCPIQDCDYRTAYRHNLLKHNKKHNENIFYKCDKCPFVTRFEGHITRHLAKIHNEVTENMSKCDFCDFSTKIKWRLNIHKQRSLQGSLLKCHFCEFETYYMCESKKHKTTHYNEIYNKKSVQLPQDCQEDAEQEPERESEDDNAPQYTLDPDCLDWNSIQVLESDDKDKPFQCHMCNYTARFKASVQRHFQRHHTGTKNKPYKCVNCDFSTKTKDQIALHNKRSHSDVLVYCNRCKFSTKYKCQLVMHQKCHYDNKCPKCEYTCRHKYELQKHFTLVHLGNGIKCQYCEYTASRKDSLLCHETIHTGDKPFKCEYCVYTSVRKCLLNNHMKRYHSDIKNDVTVVSETKIESLRLPAENIMELQQLQQIDLQMSLS